MIDSLSSMIELNCNVKMPGFGLGVFRAAEGNEVISAVQFALDHGYRMIDTATFYENEAGVGQGVRQSNVPREDVFVVTKIWPTDFANPQKAFEDSLRRLNMDYVDMYLMHWPGTDPDLRYKVWESMLEFQVKGKIRACGVSNFLVHHIQELQDHTGTIPACDQVEFHPWTQKRQLREFCSERDILVSAWGPLLHGHLNEEPLLAEIGKKYNKSAAQVTLRWDVQSNVATIPKSVHPERILSNADIFDFSLSEEDMAAINALDGKGSFGADPDTFNG